MTPAVATAIRIDNDRAKVVRRGMRAASLLASRMRRSARSGFAIRSIARQDVLPLLTDAMIAAHLSGMRRTQLIAAPQFRRKTGYKFAGSVYDEAIRYINKQVELTQLQIERLRLQYTEAAANIIDTAISALERRLQDVLRSSIVAGEGAKQGAAALGKAFEDEGFGTQKPYRMEAIFRTQTQIAYSAGRWESLSDPAVDQILWGFEYVAILDNRTTDLCTKLDGVVRPKFDPFWQTYTPPNHWNCRSAYVEIFDRGTATPVPDGIAPIKGFGFNPGTVFKAIQGVAA